ncbi:hypothetical protein AALP_AA6G333300 [Arabis alpina]|uniref:Uncharacterized protein n=1 Tax=Arabis alpina TaxID=50452 RepID=A0A087GTB6_ARAAL|nr:hypothetical protein AALP_AA6G333300 [Arabis alpina]
MKFHDDELLLCCYISSSYIWSEVIQPPEPATFSGLPAGALWNLSKRINGSLLTNSNLDIGGTY